jgi:hypothetical protein
MIVNFAHLWITLKNLFKIFFELEKSIFNIVKGI